MAKKFNLDTVKEMKTKPLVFSILYIIGAIILIAIGAMIAGKGGGAAIVFGLLIAAGGGGWAGYTGYSMIIDSKNEKTCNVDYWSVYNCVANPTDKDADYELNITECIAQTNAQYKGFFSSKYGGVWLRSNTTNTSNVDAFYVPSDKETLALTYDSSTPGARLYIRKPKAQGDSDKGVTATGATNGCAGAKSLGSIVASSPSASGVTLKLSGMSGLADTDSITLTIVSTASPPSSSSPIVTSQTVTTLKTGYTITGQSMAPGTYRVTASHTSVLSSVSTNFTV